MKDYISGLAESRFGSHFYDKPRPYYSKKTSYAENYLRDRIREQNNLHNKSERLFVSKNEELTKIWLKDIRRSMQDIKRRKDKETEKKLAATNIPP